MTVQPRILIVEDEFLIAHALKMELVRAGFPVCGLASRGEDAVRQALDLHPDLILMDIGLNGQMNGFEAAGEIHAVEEIPIIFVSGYLDEPNRARAAQYRPLACLSKPVSFAQLRTIVEHAGLGGRTH